MKYVDLQGMCKALFSLKCVRKVICINKYYENCTEEISVTRHIVIL